MNMIERVARALCTQAGEDPDLETPYHPKVTHLWQHYKESSRAAIEAMREATDEMKDAWWPNTDIRHYQAMIDAALQEGKETGE